MRTILSLCLGGICLLAIGCVNKVENDYGSDYAPQTGVPGSISVSALLRDQQPLVESLFKGDDSVISGEEIQRIFAADIEPQSEAHVAILRFGERRPWTWWTEELAQLDEESLSQFANQLQQSDKVDRVTIVPTLLMPGKMTIPYLRETAARLQADMLVVYRTNVQSYQHDKLFGRDVNKARCTVEAVLLDTRTGVVLETAIVSRNFTAERSSQDPNFYETIARAEQQATAEALAQIGQRLARFIDGGPVLARVE